MRIAITGGRGFLGWHTSCRLRAEHGIEPARLTRADFASVEQLAGAIGDAEVILHLAGVNRADSDAAVEQGNIELATALANAIRPTGRPVHVVYANSIQADQDTPYGRGKRRAAVILGEAVSAAGGTFTDVVLPNLFGEHGRPRYNSFVATFCEALATGGRPEVKVDAVVPLLHVQQAAEVLIAAARQRVDRRVCPPGEPHRVSEVLRRLETIRDLYATGELPTLETDFDRDLFNTYRSHLFPQHFPIHPTLHEDDRGGLSEVVRAHGGTGMAFVSTTRPGQTRGNHYHLRKVERFFVAAGEAEIALRRLYDHEVVRFRLSGDRPGYVDMPTLWVHHIRNVGESDLVTVFWADQLLAVEHPDQYPEQVEEAAP